MKAETLGIIMHNVDGNFQFLVNQKTNKDNQFRFRRKAGAKVSSLHEGTAMDRDSKSNFMRIKPDYFFKWILIHEYGSVYAEV